MRSKFIMLALSAMCCTSAFAVNGSNTVFSCTATNGNKIEVTKIGSDYQFSYGKTVFKNAIKNVLANEQSEIAIGSGFISNSLEMKDQGQSYIIHFGQPRNNLKAIEGAGFYTVKNNDIGNETECASGKVYQNFDTKAMRTVP